RSRIRGSSRFCIGFCVTNNGYAAAQLMQVVFRPYFLALFGSGSIGAVLCCFGGGGILRASRRRGTSRLLCLCLECPHDAGGQQQEPLRSFHSAHLLATVCAVHSEETSRLLNSTRTVQRVRRQESTIRSGWRIRPQLFQFRPHERNCFGGRPDTSVVGRE